MQPEDQLSQPIEKDQTSGVTDSGMGRAIVFLHGFMADSTLWKDFTKPLQKEYRIVALDLPGHGNCPESAEGKSIEQMADYVHQTITGLRIEKCLLVGHSMGGYVALALARKYPEQLAGLCLFHSSSAADGEEKKADRDKTADFIAKHGPAKFAETFVKPLFHESSHQAQQEAITSLEKTAGSMKTEEVVAAIKAMRDRPESTEVLQNAAFPVLFIIGKDDSRYPLETAKEHIAMPKNSQALLLGSTGHMGMLERYEDTVLVLEQFADRVFGTVRL